MLVVMDPLGEPEVLAVEGGRPLPIADGQGDVVERHPTIIAARSATINVREPTVGGS